MKNFRQFNHNNFARPKVDAAMAELAVASDLWGANPERCASPDSPHRESQDIWLRYRAREEIRQPADFGAPHVAAWYPAFERLHMVRGMIFDVARAVLATAIGGCLITRIPAGKRIYEHEDHGWHAEFYHLKVYVILAANLDCLNHCGGECVVMHPGEVWSFRNDIPHSVENNGTTDRIAMILTFRTT